MNRRYTLKVAVFFLILSCPGLFVVSASAHRVTVFAWADGNTIHVESKFAGGKRVASGKIAVMDPQGNELLTGLTDDQGRFSFKAPRESDLRIVLMAGQGHQAEWTLGSAPMASAPSPSEKALPKTTDPGMAPARAGMTPDEIEAVVASVMDRKLKPVMETMADLRQEGPTVKDVMAGIGYILGLVGIAAYVHSRKKRG